MDIVYRGVSFLCDEFHPKLMRLKAIDRGRSSRSRVKLTLKPQNYDLKPSTVFHERRTTAMFSTARSKGLERAIAISPIVSLPAFLLPAFPIAPSRSFSASTCRPSQIGRAPLSIPPEVQFNVVPPVLRKNMSPAAARPTVVIEGPLGRA